MKSTTLWEGWKAGPSYNHIMFGDISAWLYAWIAGIQQEEGSVAFERILFRPTPVGDLTTAYGSYLSPREMIISKWTRSGERMDLELTVPGGATARFIPPAGSRVTRGGMVELGAGTHQITLTLA